jgi:hypothetical protein
MLSAVPFRQRNEAAAARMPFRTGPYSLPESSVAKSATRFGSDLFRIGVLNTRPLVCNARPCRLINAFLKRRLFWFTPDQRTERRQENAKLPQWRRNRSSARSRLKRRWCRRSQAKRPEGRPLIICKTKADTGEEALLRSSVACCETEGSATF